MTTKSVKLLVTIGAIAVAAGHVMYSLQRRADERNAVLLFPAANSRETYFTLHNIRAAHALSTGAGVKVGILDHSFATARHAGLYAGGMNFVPGDDEFLTTREWHGYWMAAVLREVAPDARIYALNTYAFTGPEQRAAAMTAAIDWAIANHLDVLSYSAAAFQGAPRQQLDSALQRAHAAGIATTFLHTGEPGNILPTGLWEDVGDGREADVNVLQYDYSVVFVDQARRAVGDETTADRPFLSLSATAAVTAGVVALMKGLNPRLSPAQCQAVLRESARPMVFGRKKPPRVLDALAALDRVRK